MNTSKYKSGKAKFSPISHVRYWSFVFEFFCFVLFCSTSREYKSVKDTLISDIHFYFIDKKFASKIRYYFGKKSTQTVIYQ